MNPVITGRPAPLGATVGDEGTNFSLYSRTATGVELLFFDREDAAAPARVVAIDPVANRTYHYWHTFVPGVKPGQLYGYRVKGPLDPSRGLRFNPAKVLIDPYARGIVVPEGYSPGHARGDGDNCATATARKISARARANAAALVTGGKSRVTVGRGRAAAASGSILSSSRPAKRSLLALRSTPERTACRSRAAS